MSNIDISIIVPIYNVETYLPKCIDSILNQTFKNFELILVNDGSPDRCGAICDRYAKLDSRIKVIHKDNGGVSSARNAGLDTAKGNYIGFVDPDDYIDAEMYLRLFNLCEDRDADIAVCRNIREINGQIEQPRIYSFEIIEMNCVESLKQMFIGNLYRFALWNKLYRRHCLEDIRFPEGRIHEDLSVNYLFFINAKKVVFTDYPGYIYVKRNESILTKNYNKDRLQSLEAWEEIIDYMKFYYPFLMKYVKRCAVFWIIDNANYIQLSINDTKDKQYLLSCIRKFLKENFILFFDFKNIPLNNIFTLILLMINEKILLRYWNVKRIAKSIMRG